MARQSLSRREVRVGCARTGSRWRWPRGIIPYTINNEDFPRGTTEGDAERDRIQEAVDAWNNLTVITFQPWDGERNWVEFVASNEEGACHSEVGKQYQGRQYIFCDPSGTSLIHEMGHTIGLWHEHQREDRDSYVTVHLENVRSDKRGNFPRHVDDGSDLGAYNYESVMHYGERGFAVDYRAGTSIGGHLSREGPALAATGNELHLVHIGEESNDIWHSWSTNGEQWTMDRRIPNQKSKAAPSVVEWNGALHMVHLGDT